jgi:hypothetical protein
MGSSPSPAPHAASRERAVGIPDFDQLAQANPSAAEMSWLAIAVLIGGLRWLYGETT